MKKYLLAGIVVTSLILSTLLGFWYFTPSQGGVILVGGDTFPREAIEWAYYHSNGKPFVVISHDWVNEKFWKATTNPYELKFIVLKNRQDAQLPENVEKINRAGVIIIDGGSQNIYVDYLKGTKLNDAINLAIQKNTPIMGISAGAAILGEFYYSAKDGSIKAEDIPNHPHLNLEQNFFKITLLHNIIVDTHYSERNRETRLLAFLSELGSIKPITGIGIDGSTALCIDRYGNRKIYGQGYVYTIDFKKKFDGATS